ncbi:alkyldihydroxyacetonephosphate synthase [Kibdelosporangium banguiense]|uniref:Alkyldihydroxyacetonephosphate synthase n=1 Tax=Kibdelosporangium banguiense TaxID=1365924 RepID=A0ABS4TR47_9PSEU|nr:FAD-binding oxidoreductase [Kibdelosporangium banguiense]MBP2326884.1 alkyldihydroxyacetonephosphate synthase [Kibdelosporangium banguiense]
MRSWWGWGHVAEAVPDQECVQLGALLPGLPGQPLPVPRIEDLGLPPSAIAVPASLDAICTTDKAERASHTYGKAYRDTVRALYGRLDRSPDIVAYPQNEGDVVRLLDWAGDAHVAVVPYGGGSSVVGGVEYRGGDHTGVLSLDLSKLDSVIEVDPVSRAARVQAGVFGPALEDQLKPYGLTLRHFPQSFEFSTLGGWLATRAGGHYATLYTHIDDLVESLRVITPVGVSESWRLPGSGAGPSPDRLFLGSEGALGVITEAWVRLQNRPTHKASTAILFSDFADAVAATKAVAQSGLHPSNCRLLDAGEAQLSGAGDGANVLLLGFEGTAPVSALLEQAAELALAHRGRRHDRENATESWRSSFLRMPYIRDALARMSAIAETFETATTWNAVGDLVEAVRTEAKAAVQEICGAPGMVNCRFTHVYPDGAAPYFTVIAPGRRGSELSMWDEIKAAVSEVLNRHGATITHHHAVGRDHRPWYDRQRPDVFATALRAAKNALDPRNILNPGVLVTPR